MATARARLEHVIEHIEDKTKNLHLIRKGQRQNSRCFIKGAKMVTRGVFRRKKTEKSPVK